MSKKLKTPPKLLYVQEYADGKDLYLVADRMIEDVWEHTNALETTSTIGVYVLKEEIELNRSIEIKSLRRHNVT